MVKANDHPTHAREVNHSISQYIAIDRTHRLIMLSTEREKHLAEFKTRFDKLSPATRRMLQAVRVALPMRYDSKRGYRFVPTVNRAAIARQLGRDALVPYDIRMLRALAAKRFLVESKRALPRKQCGEIWLGAGAEFVYSIPSDVIVCLLAIDPNEKERFEEQTSLGALRAAQGAKRAEQLKKQEQLERLIARSSYLQRDKARKRSWLEKIRDLFN